MFRVPTAKYCFSLDSIFVFLILKLLDCYFVQSFISPTVIFGLIIWVKIITVRTFIRICLVKRLSRRPSALLAWVRVLGGT